MYHFRGVSSKNETSNWKDCGYILYALDSPTFLRRAQEFLRVLFRALDDDANGVLDKAEFQARLPPRVFFLGPLKG